MLSVLIKAYVRQSSDSDDVYLFDFDPKSSDFEELRQKLSCLLGDLPVDLAWVDEDGDPVRLESNQELNFAVAHGVKDNTLRVNAWVSRSGRYPMPGGRVSNQYHSSAASASAWEAKESEDVLGTDARSAAVAQAAWEDDGEVAELLGQGPVAQAFAPIASDRPGAKVGQIPAEPEIVEVPATQDDRPLLPRPSRQLPPTQTHEDSFQHSSATIAGFVRTAGSDGVAKERELSLHEAMYLLRCSQLLNVSHVPFSLRGVAFFGHPAVHCRHPIDSPFCLTW